MMSRRTYFQIWVSALFAYFLLGFGTSFSQEAEKPHQPIVLQWYNDVATNAILTYRLEAISSTTVSFREKTQNTLTEIDQIWKISIYKQIQSSTIELYFRIFEGILKVNGTKVNLPY